MHNLTHHWLHLRPWKISVRIIIVPLERRKLNPMPLAGRANNVILASLYFSGVCASHSQSNTLTSIWKQSNYSILFTLTTCHERNSQAVSYKNHSWHASRRAATEWLNLDRSCLDIPNLLATPSTLWKIWQSGGDRSLIVFLKTVYIGTQGPFRLMLPFFNQSRNLRRKVTGIRFIEKWVKE